MKILYVEDNDDNVYMLKNLLSRAGFTVVVAANWGAFLKAQAVAALAMTAPVGQSMEQSRNCSFAASRSIYPEMGQSGRLAPRHR